jgi:hypothetical protein
VPSGPNFPAPFLPPRTHSFARLAGFVKRITKLGSTCTAFHKNTPSGETARDKYDKAATRFSSKLAGSTVFADPPGNMRLYGVAIARGFEFTKPTSRAITV